MSNERKPRGVAAKLMAKTPDFEKTLDQRMDARTESVADQAPVTMPGQLGAFRLEAQGYLDTIKQKEAQIEQLTQQLAQVQAAGGDDNALKKELDEACLRLSELEEKLAQAEFNLLNTVPPGSVPMINVRHLHEVPGRRRTLGQAAYQRLRANIKKKGVQEPVKLRKLPLMSPDSPTMYEIVSGHNRVAICRELGIELVPFVLDFGDDDKVDERAFWSNIAQSEPTAYELYIRLCELRTKDPAGFATNRALADYTGLDEPTVSRVMRLDDLPPATRQLLAAAPDKLGAHAIQDLANLAGKGKGEQVVRAIEALMTQDGMTQQQAVRMAAANPAAAPKEKKGGVVIKAGRAAFCTYRRVAKTVRADFESEEDAARFEEIVDEALKKLAAEKRLTKV